jgi:hypothetical protein
MQFSNIIMRELAEFESKLNDYSLIEHYTISQLYSYILVEGSL